MLLPFRRTNQTGSDGQEGDVVCVAIVPRGQAVDWSPGSFEPEVASWVPEEIFVKIDDAAGRLRVPILPKLGLYATQWRVSSGDCGRILAAWPSVEFEMKSTPAAHWAREIGHVLSQCSQAGDQAEMLVEYP